MPRGTSSKTSSSSVSTPAAKDTSSHSCLTCQRRKVKCDRNTPCSSCVKSGVECTAAPPTSRQRRRRFPERHLLDRLRHYESLLRQHGIAFQPLHPPQDAAAAADSFERLSADDAAMPESNASEPVEHDSESAPRGGRASSPPGNLNEFWRVMNRWFRAALGEDMDDADADDTNIGKEQEVSMRELMLGQAWKQMSEQQSMFLFGPHTSSVRLHQLHPSQPQIFRLWQLYLDNVNPLLKVVHAPTMQSRIIDAAASLDQVDPALEALMFAIYAAAAMSTTDETCKSALGKPQKELVASYQFACQQALLQCGVLSSTKRDCLTALFLCVVSMRPFADPRAVSSMLGLSVRIAQRLGYHSEATLARCPPFEAEMRRRLWWSLVMFDQRLCELSDCRASILTPTWDCRIPHNSNDLDLRPEMKALPAENAAPSEALFIICKSRIGHSVRSSPLLLDMFNPALRQFLHHKSNGDLATYEKMLGELEDSFERGYFGLCNPENPQHFMSIWTTRCMLAKYRLLQSFSRPSRSTEQERIQRPKRANENAIRMLECDTALMTSPLTKSFKWYIEMYYPLPAYMTLLPSLTRQPTGPNVQVAWDTVGDNYKARSSDCDRSQNIFFKAFSNMIMKAWEARNGSNKSQDAQAPFVVTDIVRRAGEADTGSANTPARGSSDNDSLSLGGLAPDFEPTILDMDLGEPFFNFDELYGDWSFMDWDPLLTRVT